ncbi:Uncharacterized protein Fot_35482 [Forsythia ovata]|uniref:Uncharacterized protein n=1 Tax=Forsythia ovata TaxID=205694 RepID=A0ABD1SLM3_9LAMI
MAEELEVAPRNVRGKAKLAFLGRTRVGKLPVSFQDGVTIGPTQGDLKREYFTPFITREDRIVNRPNKVPDDQWMVMVEYWENPKTHDQMKELADKATEDGSSMYSTGHDDIFTQVMGPDNRGRKAEEVFWKSNLPGGIVKHYP